MTNGSVSYEKRFLEWLAKQVSPAQLSVVYSAFADINSFCLSRKILEKPLFETDDLVTLSNVRETVEHNAVFAFSYRKQKPTMIVAIRHYCHFIKETTDEFTFTSSVKSESAVPATNIASKDKPSPTALFENSNRLKFIEWLDNRVLRCVFVLFAAQVFYQVLIIQFLGAGGVVTAQQHHYSGSRSQQGHQHGNYSAPAAFAFFIFHPLFVSFPRQPAAFRLYYNPFFRK